MPFCYYSFSVNERRLCPCLPVTCHTENRSPECCVKVFKINALPVVTNEQPLLDLVQKQFSTFRPLRVAAEAAAAAPLPLPPTAAAPSCVCSGGSSYHRLQLQQRPPSHSPAAVLSPTCSNCSCCLVQLQLLFPFMSAATTLALPLRAAVPSPTCSNCSCCPQQQTLMPSLLLSTAVASALVSCVLALTAATCSHRQQRLCLLQT
jgi:hypothetical protein